MSLADIRLSPKARRRINERYREQMLKWSPKRVQSNAPPVNKALAVMMTMIWEKKGTGKKPKPKTKTDRRRPRWRKGGYGVYDLRVLRRFSEWLKLVEADGTDLNNKNDRTRGRLKGDTAEILKLIPYNGWISSSEIGEQLDLSSNKVGAIIGHCLLNKYVKSRPTRKSAHSTHLYRRIRY